MNSDAVILISPPYITVGPNAWAIMPPMPIEADMVYHIRTSFLKYGKVPFFEPKWSLSETPVIGTFTHTIKEPYKKEIVPLNLDFDSIDECFEKASKVSSTVNFLFLWNIDPKHSPHMDLIFDKINSYRKKINVRILSIIPDAWPRMPDLISLISSHTDVCDKTVTVYEGAVPFLLSRNRKDLADKLDYFPCVFMALNEEKIENKSTDFCYIGAVDGSYEHRGFALDLIRNSFPDKNFFVYTNGKTNDPNNKLSKTKDYLDKVGNAKYSIVTSTRPTGFLMNDTLHNEQLKDFFWPSVHPGRFAECIINMTIPVYVQFSKMDRLPEIIDSYGACIYVQANDTPKTMRQKIESVPRMMNLYNDHISPDVLIPKLLKRT